MRTFKDNAGRTWTVSVEVDAIRRVRSALDVNLTSAAFSELLQQLLSDPVLLCDVIYVLCKPEAERQNVSDVEFGRAMAGDAIEHGTKALLEELANFTPNPRDRARVQRVLKTLYQLAEMSRDKVESSIEHETEKLLSRVELATYGRSSGSSPASSESIPAH
jgi:hypothetical protein